jgi:glycosyltransferase involved in cell wall biosynthesis
MVEAGTKAVSLILPVYNEAGNLKRNFPSIYRAMSRIGKFEIIIAEDGSTDGSKEIARSLSIKNKNVKLISFKGRSGRGAALKRAIQAARGRVIGYIDIDLAVPLRYVAQAIAMINGGCDLVSGSRYGGARARRSMARLVASRAYNIIVNVTTGSRLDDHQCGFKFWKSSFIKPEARRAEDNRWFFDTEVLLDAQRHRVKLCTLPVSWLERMESKVKADDLLYFIGAVIKYMMHKGRV